MTKPVGLSYEATANGKRTENAERGQNKREASRLRNDRSQGKCDALWSRVSNIAVYVEVAHVHKNTVRTGPSHIVENTRLLKIRLRPCRCARVGNAQTEEIDRCCASFLINRGCTDRATCQVEHATVFSEDFADSTTADIYSTPAQTTSNTNASTTDICRAGIRDTDIVNVATADICRACVVTVSLTVNVAVADIYSACVNTIGLENLPAADVHSTRVVANSNEKTPTTDIHSTCVPATSLGYAPTTDIHSTSIPATGTDNASAADIHSTCVKANCTINVSTDYVSVMITKYI